MPFQQRRTEFQFQRGNLLADGGLRQMQMFGGAREAV
jgi:hypothetical protein